MIRIAGNVRNAKWRFRFTSWGKQAEHDAKYLRKGSHVAVEFRIENSQYEKDGETFYGFQFTVEAIEYLDSKEETERREQRQREAANS